MIRNPDGQLVLSASDLTNHLACAHLTFEMRRIVDGERTRPQPVDDAHAELIRERGDAHERAQLERLVSAAGEDCVDLGQVRDSSEARRRTVESMGRGVRLVYQASLSSGRWQGRPDFLRRVDVPSGLGDFAYEVLDTKLARAVKPHVMHQLCLYNRLVSEVQGLELDHAFVILGHGLEERVDLARARSLHRRAGRRLEQAVDDGLSGTYPEPTGHCAICRLAVECQSVRRADDHLSLVAGARRDQRAKLVGASLPTLAHLAAAPEGEKIGGHANPRITSDTYAHLVDGTDAVAADVFEGI